MKFIMHNSGQYSTTYFTGYVKSLQQLSTVKPVLLKQKLSGPSQVSA